MIAYLKGEFVHKSPAMVWVDVNGTGYEVHISLNTWSGIQSLSNGMLYTWLQVKEDAHTLYGFSELAEKELFLLLISINGVGAATARMMLSSMKPDEISRAIMQGNVKQLESIKGIGKKTAERIVLELRDKISKAAPTANNSPLVSNTLEQDAFNALTALGIGRQMAEQAVQKVIKANPGDGLEAVIKKVLQSL